jgi:hypothetical protein
MNNQGPLNRSSAEFNGQLDELKAFMLGRFAYRPRLEGRDSEGNRNGRS